MYRYRRALVLSLFLILALVATGCGGAGVALHLQAGQQSQLHLTMTGEILLKTTASGGQTLPLAPQVKTTVKIEYDAVVKVDAISKDEAEISYAFFGAKMDATVDGKPVPIPADVLPDGTKLTLIINPTTGEVKEIKNLPEIKGTQAFTPDQMKEMVKESFAQLPKAGKAKVGDTWTRELPIPINLPNVTNASKLTITSKYDANEKQGGTDVARISFTAKGPLEMSMEQQGAKVTIKGTMSESGAQYLDLKSGMLHSATGETTGSVTEAIDQGGQQLVLQMDLTMKMTVTPAQ